MQFTLAYYGRSGVRSGPDGLAISLAPNLRRDRVSFAGTLRTPLRFREAVSALHAVVVSDLKYKPKDRTAYREYLAERKKREDAIRRMAYQKAHAELLAREQPSIPAGLEKRFEKLRKRYWNARLQYSDWLYKHDPAIWRFLTPCDPVVTVAPDVLFFECFSKDESSYGCLTVDRGADYSLALYEEFQKMRSYRRTEFAVDPGGFEVRTEGNPDYHEEKIDLPPSWLRGFMQLQSAMSLPMRRAPVSREGLYNVLAFLKRHRAKASPRALRYELTPGKPVTLVLEPWEQRIVLHDTPCPDGKPEVIRTWGRDRLRVLARLLPLAEGADVYLLGTGLPSIWSVKMGEMRLVLGLSGWTANDWSGATALDALAPPAEPSNDLLGDIAAAFRAAPALTFEQIRQRTGAAPAFVAAGLNRLALLGQVIHDLPAGLYRWRQIMPVELSLEQVRLDSPETEASKEFVRRGRVKLTRDERAERLRVLAGEVEGRAAEAVLDADGRVIRGQCNCSHYFKNRLRAGPCRHMQALRRVAFGEKPPSTLEQWFHTWVN
jgi:hypothetical protein